MIQKSEGNILRQSSALHMERSMWLGNTVFNILFFIYEFSIDYTIVYYSIILFNNIFILTFLCLWVVVIEAYAKTLSLFNYEQM